MKKPLIVLILISIILPATFFAQTTAPIRVGVFGDMSGATVSFGTATHNGIKLAVEKINAAGGIDGRKLKNFLEDDEGKPETARRVVRKLIDENKVEVILGEVASTNSLAAAPVAQEARIPMITPSSTNPRVTEVGDFIFRACFIDPFQGEAMAKFAYHELKARRVAIFNDESSNYSKSLAENFTQTFTKLGGRIVANESYSQSEFYNNQPAQIKKRVAAIRRAKPDALYLPGYYNEVGQIVKMARQLKMSMPILGGDGWDSPELWKLGGAALENTYITNHYSDENPAAEVRAFVKKYESEFKSKPDSLAALGYDAVYLLADAIRRAKTTDGAALRDALAATENLSGATGRISRFLPTRNPIKPVVVLKLNAKEQKFVYNSTIAP